MDIVIVRRLRAMEADLQLQLGHIKSQKEKIAALVEDLKRLQEENCRLEPKLAAVHKKKETLERDLLRFQQMERAMDFEVDLNILRDLDNPMEMDTLTSTEYQQKMEKLLVVMSELLLRTVSNYKTAFVEKEDQEGDFEQRIADAIQARNMLTEEVLKMQLAVEESMTERVREYEVVQQIEMNIAAIDAEIWLTRADSHRIADQLALLSTTPTILPCKEGRRMEETAKKCEKTIQVEQKQEVLREERLDFEDLLPQILKMLPKEEFGQVQLRAPKGGSASRASTSQPSDLTKIVRSALQMFDIELE